MKYNHITELIGNTPLLKIDPAVHGLKNIEVYAKLEYMNPFGSVKDRIAWEMIKDDIGQIQEKGQTILESSSGNTAKALQGLAGVFGVPFKTISNRIKVSEVNSILHVLGAEVEQLPGSNECPDPDDPNDPLVYIERELTSHPDRYFYTRQYTNSKNTKAHYEGTGKEIADDLDRVDYMVGTVGTSGSTGGVIKRLKEKNASLVSLGVVSGTTDFIPGIRNLSELREVGLYDPTLYSKICEVQSTQAIEGMVTLIRRTGMLVGPTTGACFSGMLSFLREEDKNLTDKRTAVFIACDRMEWYTSYIAHRRPDLLGIAAADSDMCILSQDEVDSVQGVEPKEVHAWMSKNKVIVVDVRGHMSFKVGHIPDAINIPDTLLEPLLQQGEPFERGKKIVFACPIGRRSKLFAAYAAKLGYEAYSLDTGIMGWKDQGLSLEK